MGHHKSNKQVEGNPATGHGGGLPRRPDEPDLEERTEVDRLASGLDPDPDATPADLDPDAANEDAIEEIDLQVDDGDLSADRDEPRKERKPFPPTHYPGQETRQESSQE